jgi:hypothetical protein
LFQANFHSLADCVGALQSSGLIKLISIRTEIFSTKRSVGL